MKNNELIKIDYTSNEMNPTVSGRELHAFLEIVTPYHKWFSRMCEYGFSPQIDYWTFLDNRSDGLPGKPREEHQLTINMAKELCMIQRNERGKQARQYFIQIESQWNSPELVMARALKMADAQIYALSEENELLQTENAILTPKAEYHDAVLNKKGLICVSTIAKDIGFKSAAALNKIMNNNKIIYRDGSGVWKPYSNYEWLITERYADFHSYDNPDATPLLKWTEKGRQWIIDNFASNVEKGVSKGERGAL